VSVQLVQLFRSVRDLNLLLLSHCNIRDDFELIYSLSDWLVCCGSSGRWQQ